jgi:hypothetical protein
MTGTRWHFRGATDADDGVGGDAETKPATGVIPPAIGLDRGGPNLAIEIDGTERGNSWVEEPTFCLTWLSSTRWAGSPP